MRKYENCVSDKEQHWFLRARDPSSYINRRKCAFRKRAFLVNFHITSEAVEDLRIWTLNLVMAY